MLRLVLVAIMVIQPVMFSYAMADVNHNHRSVIVSEQSYSHYHVLSEHQSHGDYQQSDDTHSANNCCASPACSGAVVSTMVLHSSPVPSECLSEINMLGDSAVLFAESKPPRQFLVFTA